jgi:hypothetical protein
VLPAVAHTAKALRVVEGISLLWVTLGKRNDMIMLGVSLAHLPGALIEPVSSFMTFDAALLADPSVAFAYCLASTVRVEWYAVDLTTLAERCLQ